MSLSNYQFSYRGVTFGDGTTYNVNNIDGIHDMSVRSKDRDNPRSHGTIPGRHSAAGRKIDIDIEVMGTPGSVTLHNAVDDLLAAFSPSQHQNPSETDDQFDFKFPGEDEKFLYARPMRRKYKRSAATEYGLVPVAIELVMYDPRHYSTTEVSSEAQTSTFQVINDGKAIAYPILEFDPTAGGAVQLNNDTNGDVFQITTGAGSGAALIADMQRFIRGRGDLLIVYRASTNHYGLWDSPRNAFGLDPGINDLELITGDEVIVKHRDTWM